MIHPLLILYPLELENVHKMEKNFFEENFPNFQYLENFILHVLSMNSTNIHKQTNILV